MSKIKKLGLGIVAFEGCEHLKNIITTIKDSVDYVVVSMQHKSYHGVDLDPKDMKEVEMCKNVGLIDETIWYEPDLSYLETEFDPQAPRYLELEKRNLLLDHLESKGCSHALILDGDEFFNKDEFEFAKGVIDNDEEIYISYCPYLSYYKDYIHIVDKQPLPYQPFISEIKYRYKFAADLCAPCDYTRRYDHLGNIPYLFVKQELCCHNLSWIRDNIENKIDSWSSKSHYSDDWPKDECIKDHTEYTNEDSATVYTRKPNFKIGIKRLEKQLIFPKYELNEKL